MALPTSGPISLAQIQGEFGGSNPISISEYYRGAYTTNNNTSVPNSGTISLSNFYGAIRTSTISEILNVFSSNRNNFVSKLDYAQGFESNTNINWGEYNVAERYSTTVDATLYPTVIGNLLTTYTTILIRTFVAAPGTTTLYVNGTQYNVSTIAFNDVLLGGIAASSIWIAQIPLPYYSISSVRVIVNKASADNINSEEVYIIPGYWNANAKILGSGVFSIGSINNNDILFGLRSRAVDSLIGIYGSFSGVSINHLMGRELNWYSESSMTLDIATSTGTGYFDSSGDNAQVLIMRYAYS